MECTCFDEVFSYFERSYGAEYTFSNNFLSIALNACNKLRRVLNNHKNLSDHINLNQSCVAKYNLTEIKLKENYDCHSKPLSSTSLYKLMDLHYKLLDRLEYLISRSNQQKFIIFISNPFKHLLGNSNTVLNFVKCLKEYLQNKLISLKNDSNKAVTFNDTKELELEYLNLEETMKILELFDSFRDYFSSDYDNEKEKEENE